MNDIISQLGVGGGFAIVILLVVFGFLKTRKQGDLTIDCPNNIEHLATTLLALEEKVEHIEIIDGDLHRWHRPNDDGQQNWKWSSAMEKDFREMIKGIARISHLTERLVSQAEDQTDSLKTMTGALKKAIE